MIYCAKSIRPFIGAKDFDISRSFYRDLGFEESVLNANMSLFKTGQLGFYLQNGFVKDWVDNTMVFLEVEDVDSYYKELVALNLVGKYAGVRLTPIRTELWGKECFLHDPSGILWHFGEFFQLKINYSFKFSQGSFEEYPQFWREYAAQAKAWRTRALAVPCPQARAAYSRQSGDEEFIR